MADVISRTAAQVRSLIRGSKVVHRLVGTVKVPDGGGRVYKTACHRRLPTQHAVMTTAKATCAECEDAT